VKLVSLNPDRWGCYDRLHLANLVRNCGDHYQKIQKILVTTLLREPFNIQLFLTLAHYRCGDKILFRYLKPTVKNNNKIEAKLAQLVSIL